MKKEKIKKITLYVLLIFMILQPFLDIYYLYTDNIINIFKFSPATIIRIIFIIFLVISSYLIIRKKINKKYLFTFIIIYFIYTFLHIYNNNIFSYELLKSSYSNLKEIFYLIRMISPIILIFITDIVDVKEKDFKKVILITYFIFSIIMTGTNLLNIALTSYNGGNSIIKVNFLKWFQSGIYETYGYELIASKGIFHMVNQISGVLTAFFPLLVYIVLTDKFKIKNIVVLLLTILSMLMLGTPVASLGMILVLISSIFLYFIFQLIERKNKLFTTNLVFCFIFLFLTLLIYKYTPVANRTYLIDKEFEINNLISETGAYEKLESLLLEIEIFESSNLDNLEYENELEIINQKKANYIKEYYEVYGFNKNYILNIYPYEQDLDFWLSLFQIPYKERCTSRQLKSLITSRIIELNDNKLDKFFGISFTRLRNFQVYMENDIKVHYYTIGTLGIILFILPYLFIVIFALYKMIDNRISLNYLNFSCIFSILLVYIIGYLTGNIFDEWIVTLYLGFTTGFLLSNIKKVRKDK